MARFIRSIIGYNDPIAVEWQVGPNVTILEGDIVELDGTTREIKKSNATDTTNIGIAQQGIVTGGTVTPDDKIAVIPLTDIVARIDYVGTTKTSLATTDLVTTLFALKAPSAGTVSQMDLDVTAGGWCSVVAYDNVRKTADVIFKDANIAKIG